MNIVIDRTMVWHNRGGSRISERGANHSSGSLKQGVPDAIGYFVL